jgi:hypothetical protein
LERHRKQENNHSKDIASPRTPSINRGKDSKTDVFIKVEFDFGEDFSLERLADDFDGIIYNILDCKNLSTGNSRSIIEEIGKS